MNTTKAHGAIAAVYKSIGNCHARFDSDVLLATTLTELKVDIGRLTTVADEPVTGGAAGLYLSRMMSEAITAGESTLKYFASAGKGSPS